MKTLLIILFFCINTITASACKCRLVSVKDEYKSSQIIVSVTVLDILSPIEKIDTITNKDGTLSVQIPVYGYSKRVLVTKRFKGNIINDTMIVAGNNSNCELYLALGKSYLIYGNIQDNKIYTSRCSRSGLLDNHSDLKFLEKKLRRKKKNVI
ncbi:MAG: hypothetical protein JNM51_11805 [Bacteroidia bacterium]|nr:hypothetical protein [Bacteroidia bacterium]